MPQRPSSASPQSTTLPWPSQRQAGGGIWCAKSGYVACGSQPSRAPALEARVALKVKKKLTL